MFKNKKFTAIKRKHIKLAQECRQQKQTKNKKVTEVGAYNQSDGKI